jgi:hypothetical protein
MAARIQSLVIGAAGYFLQPLTRRLLESVNLLDVNKPSPGPG